MIQFKDKPNAGEYFKIEIMPQKGESNHLIEAWLDENLIYKKEIIGCDDPPCHEEVYINAKVVDKTLTVKYRNNLVEQQIYEFNIENTNLHNLL